MNPSQSQSSTYGATPPAGFSPFPTFPNNTQPQQGLGTDPNSPDLFAQSITTVLERVARLRALAVATANAIDNAYQAGNTPAQTEAELARLKQSLSMLQDILRTSGVGALPIVSSSSDVLNERQLMVQTERCVNVLHEKLKRAHDGAGVVASLLNAPEVVPRGK